MLSIVSSLLKVFEKKTEERCHKTPFLWQYEVLLAKMGTWKAYVCLGDVLRQR